MALAGGHCVLGLPVPGGVELEEHPESEQDVHGELGLHDEEVGGGNQLGHELPQSGGSVQGDARIHDAAGHHVLVTASPAPAEQTGKVAGLQQVQLVELPRLAQSLDHDEPVMTDTADFDGDSALATLASVATATSLDASVVSQAGGLGGKIDGAGLKKNKRKVTFCKENKYKENEDCECIYF